MQEPAGARRVLAFEHRTVGSGNPVVRGPASLMELPIRETPILLSGPPTGLRRAGPMGTGLRMR